MPANNTLLTMPTPTVASTSKQWSSVLDDLFARSESENSPLETGNDPLAQSCGAYRAWTYGIRTSYGIQTSATRWPSLGEVPVALEDINMADEIRKYYRDRYMIKTLKGHTLTNFQSDLYRFCAVGKPIKKDVGMIFKLPYLYAEDQKRQLLYDEFNSKWSGPPKAVEDVVHTLTPVMHIFCSRRKFEIDEFWYHDEDDRAVCIKVRTTDYFNSLMRGWFEQPQIKVRATYVHQINRAHPDFVYCGLSRPQMVF